MGESMKCWLARRKLTAYADNRLPVRERRELASHLAACRSCADNTARQLQARTALRSLPRQTVPPDLTMRLRVLASHERARSVHALRSWWERVSFSLANILRPLGVPVAGGLASTVLLFSTLVPTFTVPPVSADVPAVLFTGPILKNMAPIGFVDGDAVVDLRIDEQGRIVNWTIVESAGHTDAVHRSIENSLLFTRFTPGRIAPNSCTDCGVPTAGTIRLVFRSSHIEVRG